VHHDQVGAGLDRPLEQLAMRRDAGDDGPDLVGAGDLQPVGPVVAEPGRLQQLVQVLEDVAQRGDEKTQRKTWRIVK
jgi:hypothetical protein